MVVIAVLTKTASLLWQKLSADDVNDYCAGYGVYILVDEQNGL
jgi:hypothetical protein